MGIEGIGPHGAVPCKDVALLSEVLTLRSSVYLALKHDSEDVAVGFGTARIKISMPLRAAVVVLDFKHTILQ